MNLGGPNTSPGREYLLTSVKARRERWVIGNQLGRNTDEASNVCGGKGPG